MVCLCEHWESDGVLEMKEEKEEYEDDYDYENDYYEFLEIDKNEKEKNNEESIKSDNINLNTGVEIKYSNDIDRTGKAYDFEENGKKYIHIGYCKLAKSRIEPLADFCCPIKSDFSKYKT